MECLVVFFSAFPGLFMILCGRLRGFMFLHYGRYGWEKWKSVQLKSNKTNRRGSLCSITS